MTDPTRPSATQRLRTGAGRAHWVFRLATARLRLRPTFLILGAQKAGTTSLHRYLTEHPAVLRASPKEVRYFSTNYARGEGWYRAQFPLRSRRVASRVRAGAWPAVGEASPQYLFHPLAPQRVHAFDPALKLIAILRDPVDRAYSQYQMQLRWGYEHSTFEESLDREEAELEGELAKLYGDPPVYSTLVNRISYVARGRYAEQLERWLALFPREQLLVLLSEELFAQPAEAVASVCRFLRIPERRAMSYPHLAGGGGVFEYQPLHPATRERLARAFVEPNRRLEELLGRELPWTQPAHTAAAPAPEPAAPQPA